MGQMLTVGDVAALKSCTPRYIKRIVKEGKLPAEETLNQRKRKTYLIPLEALDEGLQRKWYRQKAGEVSKGAGSIPEKQSTPELDAYSEKERQEIDFWVTTIHQWLEFRTEKCMGSKAEADETFIRYVAVQHPERSISIDILYRKWKAVRENDLDALTERRGRWRRKQSSIPEIMWQCFLYYFLDESKYPIVRCCEYTRLWLQEYHSELVEQMPSHYSFRRRMEMELPESVRILFREGEKAFYDKCRPYIRRLYEDMDSNEFWIADNHTFDIILKKDGKMHRKHLTAFLDARSGIFTGWYVTDSPSSNATLIALRRGIKKYGIPKYIYVDNGREFLATDIGGLGHRRKKRKRKDGKEVHLPPGVFANLGIEMINALVRNARAKIIERRFRDVKDSISRLFESYTGGNVVEKPDRLKKVIKQGNVYTDEEFEEMIEYLIDYYANMELYNGKVAEDKGKIKMDVFNEHLNEKRTATDSQLTLLMMRSSRMQKVDREGVYYERNGARIHYWDDNFVMQMLGKSVYYRYDPDDLSSVRIYDEEDRYLCTVAAENGTVLTYKATQDELNGAMAKIGKVRKAVKALGKDMMLTEMDQVPALDLVLRQAKRNKETYQGRANPKIIEMQRVTEEPLLKRVSGAPDLDLMLRNAEKERKE